MDKANIIGLGEVIILAHLSKIWDMDMAKCTGNKILITKVNGSKVSKMGKDKSIKMGNWYKKVFIKMGN